MKKNEYVAPEMEVVELTEQCTILEISNSGGAKFPGDGNNSGYPNDSRRGNFDDED